MASKAASFLKQHTRMTDLTPTAAHRIVHWTFELGANRLTCAVDAIGPLYRLSISPNGHDETAIAETFRSGAAALQRHAGLAARLREHGWTVIAYTGDRTSTGRHQHAA